VYDYIIYIYTIILAFQPMGMSHLKM